MRYLRLLILSLFLLPPAVGAQDVMQEVTVSPGDTMWSIANKYLKDPQKWPEIVKHNNLPTSDPTIALPGTRIKIPVLLIKEEFRNAELIKMVPEVRYKRKGEPDWRTATLNMILKYEDSLRTLKGAEARVKFPSKEVVQINENSYVILKPEKILQEVQLLQGDIRASRAKVIMPGGTVVKPQGTASDYQAKVREDKTEVVFVYKGEVDVTAQGKTVKVKEGFGTQIPKSAPPMQPMPLTSFKDFNPTEMATKKPDLPKFEASKGVVKFNPPAPAAEKPKTETKKSKSVMTENVLVSYTLQLAKDDKFQQVVLTKTEPMGKPFDVKEEKIPDGEYFMRVSFTDAIGVTGPYSAPNSLTKDTTPPQISMMSPQDGQQFEGEAFCDVIGNITGAAVLTINGEVAFISQTGRFEHYVRLKEGANKISVLARDTQGNETKLERKVFFRP